eukprot:m.261805 g.261805  ORF g.261805 m.261805 type:complete len:318 (-) comp43197_c0_seq1:277-1230(-)
MANLITSHDPYHVHKILGLLALLNYLFRFYNIFTLGTAFPDFESKTRATVSVLLLGALSWSSLLLPLPIKRNFASPMIWPEFRLHSITFASRHVIGTLVALNHLWPTHAVGGVVARILLVVGTQQVASAISKHFGDKEKRTTNAMPYPKTVTEDQKADIKSEYARCQFGATILSVHDDPTIAFAPLLAIQGAALLMTLVRKGKIEAIIYHRLYAMALWINYCVFIIRVIVSPHVIVFGLGGLATKQIRTIRMKYRYPTEVLWSVGLAFTFGVVPTYIAPLINTTSTVYCGRAVIMIMMLKQAFHRMFITYRPLLTSR